MSEPTHVFIGVRHGRVFAIAATVETVSTWLEEEGADLIQRVPLAEARTLLFQPLPMLAEIDTLRAENERLAEENARLTRNNEMWRSQVCNQASQIEALRDQVAALSEAQP